MDKTIILISGAGLIITGIANAITTYVGIMTGGFDISVPIFVGTAIFFPFYLGLAIIGITWN